MHEEWNRRSFLRSVGGASAVGGLVASSGCTGLLGGNGGRSGREPPDYEHWVPAPEAVDGAEGGAALAYLDLLGIRNNSDAFGDTAQGVSSPLADGGEGLDSVNWMLTWLYESPEPYGLVLGGDFDAADMEDRVEALETPYTRDGTYREYTRYGGDRRTIAVGDGILVMGIGPERAVGLVETAVDAGNDDARRLVDADDEADRVVSAVGGPLSAAFVVPEGTFPPTGDAQLAETFGVDVPSGYGAESLTAAAHTVDLDGSDATVGKTLVYRSEDDLDADVIREAAAERDEQLLESSGRSVDTDGRVGTVTGTVDPTELSYGRFSLSAPEPRDGGPSTPEFDVQYRYDESEVELTVVSGRPFTAEDTESVSYGIRGDPLASWPLPVKLGSSVTVDGVEDGDVVVVRRVSADSGMNEILKWRELP